MRIAADKHRVTVLLLSLELGLDGFEVVGSLGELVVEDVVDALVKVFAALVVDNLTQAF